MASKVFFNGRGIILPGTYSTIKSGLNNPPQNLDYGKILVLDTGLGASYGGGSGIDGENSNGVDSIYEFTGIQDYRNFLKGGYLWAAAEPLFKPKGSLPGVSTVYHVRAASTTSASVIFAPTGGSTNGGTVTIKVKDEGLVGNGEVNSTKTELYLGYGFTLEVGVQDSAKFLLKFYKGTYRGKAADDIDFDETKKTDTKKELLLTSIEFNNMQEVIDWMATDKAFNTVFKSSAGSVKGSGAITTADLAPLGGVQVFAGGTESYTTNNLDKVFEAIKDLDYTFVLCTDSGSDAQSAYNGKILSHLNDKSTRFEKFMVVGGGADSSEFLSKTTNSTVDLAKHYNSDRVIAVHSSIKKTSRQSVTGFKVLSSFYHAAAVLGRIAGIAPQVPPTFKALDIDGLVHNLTEREKEIALESGVLATIYDRDFQDFIILQGVNTLQNNQYLVNPDASSYSIQLKRIVSQINKELIINSKLQLLSQPAGVNRNTLTAKNVEDWVKGYLQRITATSTTDNLILSFRDVSVQTIGDAYNVSYGIVPNTEINKLFFTGFILS